MLNKKHQILEIKTKALVDSLFIGNYKTNLKGRGIEFVDYKEYDHSDNVKNIDFITSAKEGKTLVKLYEEEKELSIYFLINLDDRFFLDNTKISKLDNLYELIYLLGFSAIKGGDKVGAYIFNKQKKKLFIAKRGKQNLINIINGINSFQNFKGENSIFKSIKSLFTFNENEIKDNKKDFFSYFNSLNIKNSLVFYISDSLFIDKKQLKILGIKNDFIFCNIFNSFENNLNGKGITNLGSLNNSINIDLDNKEKILEYIVLRRDKINKLGKIVRKNGGKYILIDETVNIYKELYKIFKK